MPLPDERPRQSVANLIGRFEKQKSSTGSPAPPITFPRTSSVASHRTGDSAQEEVKEKREWPPKSRVDNPTTSVFSQIQPSENRFSLSSLAPLTDKGESAPPEIQRASPPATEAKAVSSLPPEQPPPQPTPAKAKSPPPSQMTPAKAKSPPPSQVKPTSIRTSTSVKSPTPRVTAKAASEGPKPQSSGGSAPSSSTSLKPQHTGQSTTSTKTATRVATKPRASVPPKTPAVTTPARSRTPLSTTRPKTPSSAPRAKTPLSNARPKTPSGLYAPTAASLARSRAGAPAPPPVEKPKRKVTTDLSKPTAASASRMRSPAPVPAAKVGKSSTLKATASKAPVRSAVSKALTPAKRVAAVKSGGVPAAVDDKVGTKDSESRAPISTEATVPASIPLVDVVAAGVSDEISQQDDSEAVVSNAGDVMEEEPQDIDHSIDAHEGSTADEEHLELDEQPDSHDDEEIENYDEDFPDDTPHETLEQPESEHVAEEVDDDDGSSLVEEPIGGQITVPGNSLPDDDGAFPVAEDHGGLLEGEESTSTSVSAEPQDILSQLNRSEVVSEPHDVAEDQPGVVVKEVGSDLEDIVNLLESGPQIQRPSVESSPAGGTVLEAGEIPDEY